MRIKVPADSLSVLFSGRSELGGIAARYNQAGHPAGEFLGKVCETLRACQAAADAPKLSR